MHYECLLSLCTIKMKSFDELKNHLIEKHGMVPELTEQIKERPAQTIPNGIIFYVPDNTYPFAGIICGCAKKEENE